MAVLISMMLSAATSAATITDNSLLDDVFVNASGQIFSDVAYTNPPLDLASAKCTLRMAVAAANTDSAIGGTTFGCAAGSGTDTINFTVNGRIKLSQVAMETAPVAPSVATWLLFVVAT